MDGLRRFSIRDESAVFHPCFIHQVVLVRDPGATQRGPVELDRHMGPAGAGGAVAVLPDGRLVTGGNDDRVQLRNVQSSSPRTLLG